MVTGFVESTHLDQRRASWIVAVVGSFVFDRGSHPGGSAASLPVVENLDVAEYKGYLC